MKDTLLRFASGVALVSGLLAQTSTQIPAVTGAAVPSTSPEHTAQSPATFKVTTRLVLLNVLVHDHHGHPVGDLSKADFEVTDAGRLQTINLFSVDQFPHGSTGTPPGKTLPANVVTNRPPTQLGIPFSVTVLLIDTYNTKLTDQGYAKRQLIKFLSKVLPEDQVAIYTLNSNGLAIVHDFTNNAESLKTAIAKAAPQFSHELDGAPFDRANTGSARIGATLEGSNVMMSNFFTGNRIVNTCAALKSLADHLSGIPGRKNLVWNTGGLPMELLSTDLEGRSLEVVRHPGEEYFASYIAEAGQALNNANVAVYPVDSHGVMTDSLYEASGRPMTNLPLCPPTPDQRPCQPLRQPLPSVSDSELSSDHHNAMTKYLADLTGGKAFHDTNDLAEAVRKAIDDSSVSYTLGYYVAASEWNNRYHEVKVAVRRSGMNVRTKKGYLAQYKPPPTSAHLDDVLKNAVWSPLDSTRIAITARIDPSPVLPNASRFSFAIDPTELDFGKEQEGYRGEMDVLFLQEHKGGGRAAELKRTIKIALTPERYKVVQESGMILSADLRIHPDTVAVRIIVVDRSSEATGSVTVAVGAEDKSGANVIPPAGQTAAH